MEIEKVVYDLGNVKRVAHLNSDNGCAIFNTYAIQDGKVVELLETDIVSEKDAEIALSLLRGQ